MGAAALAARTVHRNSNIIRRAAVKILTAGTGAEEVNYG